MNWHERNIDVLGLENDAGAADCHFPDPAGTKSAADRDAFSIPPSLQLEIAANDQCKFLGKVFDRALHHTRGFRLAFSQQRIERLLAEIFAGLIAERVVAVL